MLNPYAVLLDLLPKRPRNVGVVEYVAGDVATIILEGGGGVVHALGKTEAGKRVYVRDGQIEGEAPNLTYVEGEA